ncbi:MAG: hypothetical protein RML12_05695 [Xanthomonadales bacterium]|nr:hypothetical protein [Xanthomonadales bacterium]
MGLALSSARHLASFLGLAFAYGHVALLFAAALAPCRVPVGASSSILGPRARSRR